MLDPKSPHVLPIGHKFAIAAFLPCNAIELGDGKKVAYPGSLELR
jgi:hypothetical protein